MTLERKLIALLAVLLLGCGWSLWRTGQVKQVAPTPAIQVAAVAREVEKTTTQLKCSDGTVVTQTDSRADTSQATGMVTVPSGSTPRNPYSLRLDSNPSHYQDIGVSVSVRLGDLPLSIVGGAELHSGAVSPHLGLQLDF